MSGIELVYTLAIVVVVLLVASIPAWWNTLGRGDYSWWMIGELLHWRSLSAKTLQAVSEGWGDGIGTVWAKETLYYKWKQQRQLRASHREQGDSDDVPIFASDSVDDLFWDEPHGGHGEHC